MATIMLCLIIARSAAASRRSRSSEDNAFWSRESEANSVRRKDISDLDYIEIPLDSLPMDELLTHNEKKSYDIILNLSSENILNLSSYSNTDLKMMYGPANLDELSRCDDNFTTLIRTLHKAGETLTPSGITATLKKNNGSYTGDTTPTEIEPDEIDNTASAIKFLEYSISIGSDMSSTYELLGEIYFKTGNRTAFEKLYENADKLSSISKPVIISKLNSIKNKWK
jgi:hypothetical protein